MAQNALVSVDGNRYSVPPALVGDDVRVRRRLGSDELVVISAAGTVVATHRTAPRGVGRVVRLPEHTAALENVVLAAFKARSRSNGLGALSAVALRGQHILQQALR